MRITCLAATIAMAALALSGCGGDDPAPTPQPKPEPFELDGAWIYLGPSDVPHDLVIGDSSMAYKAVAGDWSSDWTLKAYDNEVHHFQIVFKSGSGTYLPMGTSLSGAYELSGTLLTVQLAPDLTAYPQVQGAGTCTGPADGMPLPNCRLYIKGN
jgi:hypothetical protein